MLVALIDDVRVAVLKLAERVVALRLAKDSFEERKTRIATEAMTVSCRSRTGWESGG